MNEESLKIFVRLGLELGYKKDELTSAYWNTKNPSKREQKIIKDVQHLQIDKCSKEIEDSGFKPHF